MKKEITRKRSNDIQNEIIIIYTIIHENFKVVFKVTNNLIYLMFLFFYYYLEMNK
jgi:hypothetical protein